MRVVVSFCQEEHSYNNKRSDTTVTPIMATVARTEPFSYAFSKLPAREKCWKARKQDIAIAMIAPSCFPLQMYNEFHESRRLKKTKPWY